MLGAYEERTNSRVRFNRRSTTGGNHRNWTTARFPARHDQSRRCSIHPLAQQSRAYFASFSASPRTPSPGVDGTAIRPFRIASGVSHTSSTNP